MELSSAMIILVLGSLERNMFSAFNFLVKVNICPNSRIMPHLRYDDPSARAKCMTKQGEFKLCDP